MKPVWRIILGIFILAIGGSAYFWLPLLVAWVAPNSEVLQGLDALISILSTVGGLVLVVLGVRTRVISHHSRDLDPPGRIVIGGSVKDAVIIDGDNNKVDATSRRRD